MNLSENSQGVSSSKLVLTPHPPSQTSCEERPYHSEVGGNVLGVGG